MRLPIRLRADQRSSLQLVKPQHQKILGMSAYWALVSPDIEFSPVALGSDRERKDDLRNVGLGLEHDWSSHAADALGQLSICYVRPPVRRPGYLLPFCC